MFFSFSCNVIYLCSFLLISLLHRATGLTRKWLLPPLWALVALVSGRLLEAVLVRGGDGGDNCVGVLVCPKEQAAVARLAVQQNNAPPAAEAQPSTSRAALEEDRPSQESQVAQLAVGELLVAARQAKVNFSSSLPWESYLGFY
jgi:hypothetical protein